MLKTDTNLLSILKLLDDDSPQIQGIVHRQLLENSVELVLQQQAYRSLLSAHEIRSLDSTLKRMHIEMVTEALRRLLGSASEDIDLEKCILMVNYWHNPKIDCQFLRNKLQELGEILLEKIPLTGHPLAFLDHIDQFLFEKVKIEKCWEWDTQNAFLYQLLETKRGTPVTVGILCVLISNRLGVPIYGVPMPGHFILKFHNEEDEIFFDPFYGGKIYSREMCYQYLKNSGVSNINLVLDGCSNVELFVHVLKQLHRVYAHDQEKLHQLESFIGLCENHATLTA